MLDQFIAGQGGDRDRDVLDVLRPFLRRDDDLLKKTLFLRMRRR